MLDRFHQANIDLKSFIVEHPEVEIGKEVISIPESVRPEFYRLFNAVREAFVEEKFPVLLNRAAVLSQNYRETEEAVLGSLGLEEVSMDTNLQRFLRNPLERLIRELFSPLFDLLKGKENIPTFEEKTAKVIEAIFPALYREGYRNWAILSLVKLAEADVAYRIVLPQLDNRELAKISRMMEHDEVPPPHISKNLSFECYGEMTFTAPNFIVHSAKIDRYVSVRVDFRTASLKASNASHDRQWHPPYTATELARDPGLILIYAADKAEDISLVADAGRICRPDVLVWCADPNNLNQKEALEKVKLHHQNLQPIIGSYIITQEQLLEPVPEESTAESKSTQEAQNREPDCQPEGVHILTVGLDQSKLLPIIDDLMSYSTLTDGDIHTIPS